MKLTSTNIILTADKSLGHARIKQAGKTSDFISEEHLEEVRDLIDLYLDLKRAGKDIDLEVKTIHRKGIDK